MHWADKIAKEIITSGKFKPYWVDDMKTPSGFAHVGSLMGPLIHSAIFRALKNAGENAVFTFVINDFDPVDEVAPEYKDQLSKYLGYPIKNAPSPDQKFQNLADFFADDLISSFRSLGVEAKILSSWEMYHEGKFDEVIKVALDNSEKIQDIYKKVSGSQKKESGWLPFQVICENCGKLGTTKVYKWDGETVSYRCESDLVKWAVGCGHEGKMSPFGGTGKLPWKVDWAAHWKVIGVTIEGAGKDHASAGGSYDIAMEICKEVFDYAQPYKLPYEFILIGGKKMSSSKGLGLKAHDLVKIIPPELGQFLFTSHDIKSQSNFNPEGTMAIPDLFDEYDKSWRAYIDNSDENLSRVFELSQIKNVPLKKETFIPRFRDIVNYLQQPNVDIYKMFPKANKSLLDERIKYAKVWIENYAPDDMKFAVETVTKASSAKAHITFSKEFTDTLIQSIESSKSPEELEKKIYESIKKYGLTPKNIFAEIYTILTGKPYGPKIAWLIWESKENALKILKKASK